MLNFFVRFDTVRRHEVVQSIRAHVKTASYNTTLTQISSLKVEDFTRACELLQYQKMYCGSNQQLSMIKISINFCICEKKIGATAEKTFFRIQVYLKS